MTGADAFFSFLTWTMSLETTTHSRTGATVVVNAVAAMTREPGAGRADRFATKVDVEFKAALVTFASDDGLVYVMLKVSDAVPVVVALNRVVE